MARAFLYVALAAGVCVLQTTAVQAEPGNRTQSNEDVEDETVTLGFGALPAGVGDGDPSSATLTIYDTPAASLRGVPETPTNASSKITSGLATVSFAENATGAGVFLISAARDSARVDSGEHTVGDHKKTETPDTLAGRRDEAQALADLAERLEMLSTKRTNNRDGERIAAKLSRGFVGGILSGFVGLWAGEVDPGIRTVTLGGSNLSTEGMETWENDVVSPPNSRPKSPWRPWSATRPCPIWLPSITCTPT